MVVTDMRSSVCMPLDEEGRINSPSRLLQPHVRSLSQVPCHASAHWPLKYAINSIRQEGGHEL